MIFSRFTFRLMLRLGFILTTLALLAFLITQTSFYAVTLLVTMVALFQIWALAKYVDRTNKELTRFLNSIRYQDFLQTFSIEHLGSSFADLNEAFDEVIMSFRDARSAKETQARYLQALVEHVPVALVTLHGDGKVDLLNNAARRLLNTATVKDIDALDAFGAVFQRDMAQAKAGERQLTRITSDGVERQLIMSTTQITIAGDAQRVVSLQDIQSELDASELSAWQDMVRVISHEIMNSITPIASLARTADQLVDELQPAKEVKSKKQASDREELVNDIHEAIRTVARRSEGLMGFVQSYRQLTQMPPPKMEKISLKSHFERLKQLMAAEWKGRGIAFHVSGAGDGMMLMADESLLDQTLINLLRNAADAACESAQPQVWLSTRLNDRGHPVIEVADNGAGIDDEIMEKIFMPFFTTKEKGSGVGLSLARQVMLVHKGAISAANREDGGAIFRLTF